MSALEPPGWFRNEHANAIPGSVGDKKLRFDLFDMLQIKDVKQTTMDIANQFLIAAATDDVEKSSNARKTAKLPGRVAVKVGKEGEDEALVYKYAFLNLNSLAKRLRLDAKDIKQEEKKGTLDDFIRDRVGKLAKEQQNFTKMLTEIEKGHDVFHSKLSGAEEDVGVLNYQTIGLLKISEPSEQSFKNVEVVEESGGERIPAPAKEDLSREEILEKPFEANQNFMSNFIKKNFSDDKYLMGNLSGFLKSPTNEKTAKPYLKHLTEKLWWDTGELGKSLGVSPRKIAILDFDQGEFKKRLGASIFIGGAAPTPDNDGKREVMRVNMVEWDKDNRYAIAIEDDFLYSGEPPQPRSRNEVAWPLLKNNWILVNKNSLKRIGITNADLKTVTTPDEMKALANQKIQAIKKMSDELARVKENLSKSRALHRNDEKIIRNIAQNHPDQAVRDLAEKCVKALDNPEKRDEYRALSGKLGKEQGDIVRTFIHDLEKAQLVDPKVSEILSYDEKKSKRNKETEHESESEEEV